MKAPFQVWRFDFPDDPEKGGEHPVVLIGHPDRCARAKVVNVLFCTSQRQSRQPYPFEVALDEADGMDWQSLCDCSLIYSVKSALLHGYRGTVVLPRRLEIRAKLKDLFRLNVMD